MNETTMNAERTMLSAIPISKTEVCLRAGTHRRTPDAAWRSFHRTLAVPDADRGEYLHICCGRLPKKAVVPIFPMPQDMPDNLDIVHYLS